MCCVLFEHTTTLLYSTVHYYTLFIVSVLLKCSKYCTSYSILPGTTAPRPTQVFDCEAFMDKFKERFLKSVDSRAIVLRLEIEKVISEDLAFTIEQHCSSTGNKKLFLHLGRNADPGSIRKLCDVMAREEGYAKMNELGKDIRRELDLLTGMHVHAVMLLYMCIPFYCKLHALCAHVRMYFVCCV